MEILMLFCIINLKIVFGVFIDIFGIYNLCLIFYVYRNGKIFIYFLCCKMNK